jgi:hypothetical protein
LEPSGHEEERKTKEDMEEVSRGWKRSVVEEAQREGRTWREVKWLATDRSRWRSFVKALCSYTMDNRN